MKKVLVIAGCLLWVGSLAAQKIKYSEEMLQKMELIEIDVFEPLEGKYKSRRSKQMDYQKIDHTIISKKEGLEIRYAILPARHSDPSTQVPHVEFMRVVSNIAPNDEDNTVTIHTIPTPTLSKQFNADWGSIAYFKPKPSFSSAKHCRLLSLFSEDKGTIHVFYLFDEPSKHLDNRFYSVRFVQTL